MRDDTATSPARHSRSDPPAAPLVAEPRPLSAPLVRSTIHAFGTSRELAERFAERSELVYARFGNPTVAAAARELAALEGAEAGLLFASGMAAVTTTLLAHLSAGDHVVAQRDVFAQTRAFLAELAARLGVRTTFVDASRPSEVAAALEPATALVYAETPSNPHLRIADVAALAEVARARGVPLVVDSTFATPVLQRPLALGAALVVHSATKFLGGHSDVSCGAVLGSAERVRRVYETQRLLGGIAQPDAAWLLSRSLKTLELRVLRQSESALAVATFLARARGVARVAYPGLDGTPGAAVARRQMRAGGGMVAFEVEGGLDAARAVLDDLRVVRIATSLGGVESVAELPAELDFAAAEAGASSGGAETLPGGLVRLSVGLEPAAELIADLERALGRGRRAT